MYHADIVVKKQENVIVEFVEMLTQNVNAQKNFHMYTSRNVEKKEKKKVLFKQNVAYLEEIVMVKNVDSIN